MRVPFRKAELCGRIPFEIELNEHSRLVADDTPIVAGLNNDDLRRSVVPRAAILEGHVNLAASKKADVRVRAEVGSDVGLDVARPMEADRIDRSLHASVARVDNVELDAAELLMLGSGNWCEKWIGCGHRKSPGFELGFRSFESRAILGGTHHILRCALDSTATDR